MGGLRPIAVLMATALAACFDGSTVTGPDPTTIGALTIQFSGLPAGAEGFARLEGVGGPSGIPFASSRSFPGLATGEYTVTASAVLVGGSVIRPSPESQIVRLGTGESRTITIVYSAAEAFDLGLQEVVGAGAGLASPIDLQAPPGDARLFIGERPGRIRIMQGGLLLASPFLDIAGRVSTSGEGGLLSFAFHPQFTAGQPFVFVHFTDAGGDIVVERYRVSSGDANVLDPAATEVIRIPHPGFTNHYGGRIAFGPDGMLYLSTGDGGGGGDPAANGQNAGTLLGKLLRLDVSTLPYAIPASNPVWAGATPARRENWAIGLRNPWRYAFDAPSGVLYIADVGQGRREEIDAAATNAAGLNYGWNILEGTLCYPGDPCVPAGMTAPVLEYDHAQGCSIIGGYVYRGATLTALRGRYLYSDFCSGWLRTLRYEGGVLTETLQWDGASPATNVLSFGQDGAGEIYLLTLDNRVLRIAQR